MIVFVTSLLLSTVAFVKLIQTLTTKTRINKRLKIPEVVFVDIDLPPSACACCVCCAGGGS